MSVRNIGKKIFGPAVIITDPGYDRDVWCRLNNLQIKKGEYNCFIETYDDCVSAIGISLPEAHPERCDYRIAEVGVDAGLCGIFNMKPDMDQDAWEEFLSVMWGEEKESSYRVHLWDNVRNTDGFFSESGYGDGFYEVLSEKDEDGEIIALKIVFIDEDEDEDYYDDEDYDEEEEDF